MSTNDLKDLLDEPIDTTNPQVNMSDEQTDPNKATTLKANPSASLTRDIPSGSKPNGKDKEVKTSDAKFIKAIAQLEERVTALEELLKTLASVSPDPSRVGEVETDNSAPAEYVKIVQEVCGTSFKVDTETMGDGTSFKLIITPPKHLREIADHPDTGEAQDRRVKVISTIEGGAGVRAYAERVADFCQKWALRNHVAY